MAVEWKYERARKLLKDDGRTMNWLAQKCGSKPAYISHLLTGRKNPSLSMLKLIAHALDASEQYLMGITDEVRPTKYRIAR